VKGFFRAQISYLIRTLPYRKTWRYKLWTLVQAVQLVVGYVRLKIALRFSTDASPIGGRTCVAVLLTHNRPQNMSLLVGAALRNRFVTKVIVSNSNPRVRIRDWITSTDSRLMLIDETIATQPGHRLVLAKETGAEYVLSIDDDIFLTPNQWKRFFEFLLTDEQYPHGIIGQVYRPGTKSSNGSPFHHVIARDAEVDVLIGAFAFTREHLKRVFELALKTGISDLSRVRNGEDILLSFAGTRRPHIHAMRPALFCASEGLPGVALWKSEEGFWAERIRLFENAREARLTMKSPWGDAKQRVDTKQRPITA
jgi:hypothetical protein